MNVRPRLSLLAALALLGAACAVPVAGAPIEAVTDDGRRVLLQDDGTWRYADGEAAAAPPADAVAAVGGRLRLEIEGLRDEFGSCRIALRLTNDTGTELRSIVPQIGAYTGDGVLYHTVFAAFQRIRPTRDQYREIEYPGIECARIAALEVSGGDRCEIGALTKFSTVRGECLELVALEPSTRVDLRK